MAGPRGARTREPWEGPALRPEDSFQESFSELR